MINQSFDFSFANFIYHDFYLYFWLHTSQIWAQKVRIFSYYYYDYFCHIYNFNSLSYSWLNKFPNFDSVKLFTL